MSYALLPGLDPVPDGSALLLEGPPLVGKREHALRMLAHGLDAGDAGIVLTTERTAPEVVDALAEFTSPRDSSSEASLSADDLMVIDCTGDRATSDAAVPAQTQYVNSPTDLTGAGIALSDALQAFTDSHDSIRLLTDSLTSLLVYRDLKPVFEFFHNLNKWTTQVAGLSLVVSETDLPGDESLSEFAPLFDGHVQFRQESGATELRVSRLQGGSSGWVTPPPVASATADDAAPAGVTDGTREVPDVKEVISDVPASLADILADARENSQAVTAVNVTGERRLDVVESYFDRFDVPVREGALDASTPADFAVLHQGSEYVAGASLAELAAAITVERSGADSF